MKSKKSPVQTVRKSKTFLTLKHTISRKFEENQNGSFIRFMEFIE